MNIFTTTFERILTIISILTAFGVFVHDGRVDKATSTMLMSSYVTASIDGPSAQHLATVIDADAHSHPDHNAAARSLINNFTYQSPSIPPRDQEQKKHLQQRVQPRGHHAFDNYNLPVVA